MTNPHLISYEPDYIQAKTPKMLQNVHVTSATFCTHNLWPLKAMSTRADVTSREQTPRPPQRYYIHLYVCSDPNGHCHRKSVRYGRNAIFVGVVCNPPIWFYLQFVAGNWDFYICVVGGMQMYFELEFCLFVQ